MPKIVTLCHGILNDRRERNDGHPFAGKPTLEKEEQNHA
jgi:hypothetical protein